MACTILFRAIAIGPTLKGQPVSVYQWPHPWGNLEVLPDWGHFVISDANSDEMRFLMTNWLTDFEIVLQSQNNFRFVYRVKVSPKWVSSSGDGGDIFLDKMERHFEDRYDGTIINPGSQSRIMVEIPKNPGPPFQSPPPPKEKIIEEFNDAFHAPFREAKWVLPTAEVDLIVAEGGDKIYFREQSDALWVNLIA